MVEARDDRLGWAAAEAVEREPRHVRVPAEARLIVRPACQQHQHPRAGDPVEGLAEKLEGGGVDPVRVLNQHQHRFAARESEQLLDQHGQRAGTPLLRAEILCWVPRSRVDPEQGRDERRRLGDVVDPLAQQRLELLELHHVRIGAAKAGGDGELLDHWPERRAGVMGRALAAKRHVFVLCDRIARGLQQPGLANSRLADQEHRLALAGQNLSPSLQDQRQLLVAPDHWQRATRSPTLKTAVGRTLAQHLEGIHGLSEALEPDGPDLAQFEHLPQKPARTVRNHHGAGRCGFLQPRRYVRRLTHHRFLTGRAQASKVAHHDEARRDANPRREPLPGRRGEPANGLDDRETPLHGTFRVVLVRAGPPEIGQHAVAHQLGDVPADARDLARDRVLVGVQDLVHVLGIEAG
jgi:hypothetical protein